MPRSQRGAADSESMCSEGDAELLGVARPALPVPSLKITSLTRALRLSDQSP
jgi:hypothetical protein